MNRNNRDGGPVIALAGNPNVGKSTLFNALTGLRQHTGNWPGKTVSVAEGTCRLEHRVCRLVDLPGTYSLLTHSAEEEVARDFLWSAHPDAVIVVCDATCLQRGLCLLLQVMETGLPTLLCVNLMDEARRRGMTLDLPLLEKRLGIPVVATAARHPKTLDTLRQVLTATLDAPPRPHALSLQYDTPIEKAVARLIPHLPENKISRRFTALRLLEGIQTPSIPRQTEDARRDLEAEGITTDLLRDRLVTALTERAESLCRQVVRHGKSDPHHRDRTIDRLVTGRWLGVPLMLLLLAVVLWLTLVGANGISQGLQTALGWLEERLSALLTAVGAPDWLEGALVQGAFRMTATVVAVMLPPMAIFFPLFTLLEDVGYLPRIAYNLDRPFARCGACGKQALTLCMGLGCNAAGVVGCRIIDSPRERMLAVLTNSFVPCNGRFPTLILLITLFFTGGVSGSPLAALMLTALLVLAVGMTLLITRLLSATLLKGTPSFFTLELPPYRPPKVGQVILRSVLDRTLFVLGRAVAVAAPAGLVIWGLAHLQVGDASVLSHLSHWLDPLGKFLGMDGILLLSFLLALPANEVVLPLAVMLYTAGDTLTALPQGSNLTQVLTAAGWTPVTALCVMLFCLFHWPCSTTLLTIRRETGSWRQTALAAVMPTLLGFALCALVAAAARLL